MVIISPNSSITFHFSRKREMLRRMVLPRWIRRSFISHASARCYWPKARTAKARLAFISHASARCYSACLPRVPQGTLSFLTQARDATATLSSLIPYRISCSFARLVNFTIHRADKIVFGWDVHLGFARGIL